MDIEDIELIELLQILLKRKVIIFAITLAFALAAFAYTYFLITPLYESETTLMVNGAKSSTSLSDIAAEFDLSSINMNQKLVVTYSEIVRSRKVLNRVIQKLKLDMNYLQLREKVVALPVKTTEILNIKVTTSKPEQSADIANTIAEIFIQEVIRIMKVNNVEIIDEAIPNYEDINVRYTLNIAIGLVLGAMVGVLLAFLLFILDRTFKTEDDILKHVNLPVLGTIMDFDRFEEA